MILVKINLNSKNLENERIIHKTSRFVIRNWLEKIFNNKFSISWFLQRSYPFWDPLHHKNACYQNYSKQRFLLPNAISFSKKWLLRLSFYLAFILHLVIYLLFYNLSTLKGPQTFHLLNFIILKLCGSVRRNRISCFQNGLVHYSHWICLYNHLHFLHENAFLCRFLLEIIWRRASSDPSGEFRISDQ